MNESIDLTDFYSLMTVWELKEQGWFLVKLTRLKEARSLCNEPNRLVFPPGVKPNPVASQHLTFVEIESNIKPVRNTSRVLELVETCPGQSSTEIASRLGLSVAAIGRCLQGLAKKGLVHHRPSPIDKRIGLYYPGNAPAVRLAVAGTRLPQPTRREPPLKVYFVDPRTLQKGNK